ncbi:MAG: DNA-3-methyladenine glycosylase family protein [Sporichthyaceae bacterium]
MSLPRISADRSARERSWVPAGPVDLARTLGVLRRGAGDPTYLRDPGGAIWRGVRTPEGIATVRLSADPGAGAMVARAWGPGAEWICDHAPAMCGCEDDATGFEPVHDVLLDAHRRLAGWRVARAEGVLAVLIPSILEQKTTGKQARASWRTLVRAHGEPAPGPAPRDLLVAPDPATWARIPSWEWHRAGVEPAGSRAVLAACGYAGRLEQTHALPSAIADQRLRALPGIGVWTSAETRQRSHGDADAVSVGDYHLHNLVGVALSGRRVDDAGMLELLAPYAGHRYRVTRLLEMAGAPNPRYGPRITIQDHRGH